MQNRGGLGLVVWGGSIAGGQTTKHNPASLRQAATTKTRSLYQLESTSASAGTGEHPRSQRSRTAGREREARAIISAMGRATC